jgi:hypothetical protein
MHEFADSQSEDYGRDYCSAPLSTKGYLCTCSPIAKVKTTAITTIPPL